MATRLRTALASLGLIACLSATLAVPTTWAQDTGGSFGGGDFGGSDSSGSSGGSGGGSDFGGSGGGSDFGGSGGGSDFGGSSGGSDYGSTTYGGSDYGSSSYGGSGGSDVGASTVLGLVCCVFVVVLLIIGGSWFALFKQIPRPGSLGPAPQGGGMDVSAIRIALDHHARPLLQQKLKSLAESGASATKAGRAQALHEVCIELRRNETAWLHASVDNSPMVSPREAEAAFKRIASDARSRFRVETIRSVDGQKSSQVDTATRDRGEGPGLVVVTVVVAARGHLIDIHQPEDARDLHRLLQAFGALGAQDLAALEVVWSPSSEDDRMTPEELARLYPELRRIRDDTVASRVFCGYCGSPFWTGLARCPHCGAPTTDARAGAAPTGTPGA